MFTEIRIFSRGGQGGVTASKLLAYAGALQDYETQSIPKYGAERKGAPIYSDVRVSDCNVRRHAPVINFEADHFILLDPALFNMIPENPKGGAVVAANATEVPENLVKNPNIKVGMVDAYKIAEETGLIKSGTALVSTIMLGAWCKASGDAITIDSVVKAIEKKFKGKVAENNIKAVKLAYERFEFLS